MIPNAVLDSAKNRVLADSAVLDNLKKALSEFKVPSTDELVVGGDLYIRQHPNPAVERYFDYVTKAGKPCFEWSVIRPAFLWKIKHCLHELVRVDMERSTSSHNLESEYPKAKPDFDDEEGELRQTYNFIVKKAEEFDGAPFTFQRICELLGNPLRHYKRADKYFRAVDKCLNVVTTVTPDGTRITGVEDFIVPTNDTHIERSFYGKVDELDDEIWDTVAPTAMQDKPLDMSQKENKTEIKRQVDGSGDGPSPASEMMEENVDIDEAQKASGDKPSNAAVSQRENITDGCDSEESKSEFADLPNKIKEAEMEH